MSKPKILLVSMVRNESKIIKRMIDSARPWIDGFYVHDTGSDDDTIAIINHELTELPGVIEERTWQNFGHNRTELVQAARAYALLWGYEYMLLADADQVYEGEPGAMDDLTAPAYLIKMAGPFEWRMPYLVRSDLHWRYVGATHEFLAADEPYAAEHLYGFTIHHHGDGGNRDIKVEQDQRLLTEEYEQDPTNGRTVFYLAQTYMDAGDHEKAIELYRRRIELGGWDEETYYAFWKIAEMTGNGDDYLAALDYRPSRAEAWYRLIERANGKNQHRLAATLGRGYVSSHDGPCPDTLFVERWMEDYGIPLQLAVAEFWVGLYADSKARFAALLEQELPDGIRELIEQNLTYFGE